MRARIVWLIAISMAISNAGCLRNAYDLCDRADPHPECDAGAPRPDGGTPDAGADDAGSDGGASPEDSGTPMDSGASSELDAGADADVAA